MGVVARVMMTEVGRSFGLNAIAADRAGGQGIAWTVLASQDTAEEEIGITTALGSLHVLALAR